MNKQTHYHEALPDLPPPGAGYHGAILGIANLAAGAGISPEQAVDDIRRHTKPGSRRLTPHEIETAVSKAYRDIGSGYTPRPRPEPVVKDGKAALQRIIAQAKIMTEVDLWESSPVRLWDEPQGDPVLLLETLCDPTDLIWIGDRHQAGIIGKTIMAVQDWIAYIRCGGKTGPHIIPNPLTGTPAIKKTGDGETYRGDGNISSYRYCMAEFDSLSREEQIRFWSAVKLPIVALIDSGGRSIHAWIDVQKLAKVETAEQWVTEVKGRLYDAILSPLGVDAACSNPARLSRLPGHYREEKAAYQRLLWLSAEGRPISCWTNLKGR